MRQRAGAEGLTIAFVPLRGRRQRRLSPGAIAASPSVNPVSLPLDLRLRHYSTVLPQPPRIADGKREGEKEERISLAFSRIGNGGRRIGGGGEGKNRGERVKVSSPFLDPPSCYWTVADRTVGEKSPTYVHSEISAGEKKEGK